MNNKKCKIGIFDSGIGGVTVFKEIIKLLPNEEYIYYSDSINNPYGDKSKKEVIEICKEIVDILISKGCQAIVIACNTASAIAVETLRKEYSNIPFIAIEPAYKMVHDYAFNDETLVVATKGTIESEKFHLLYSKYNNHKTHLLPCVGLAEIIEQGEKEELKKYLQDNLGCYKGKAKNVVLGCTHYPLVQNEIREVLGDVRFFEGAEKLAMHLRDVLQENKLIDNIDTLHPDNVESKIEFIDSSGSLKKEERFWEFLNLTYKNNKNLTH